MPIWKEVREYRPPMPAFKQVFECLEKLGAPSDWPPMPDKKMMVRLPRRIVLIFLEEWFEDARLQKGLT
jgi:hypothetical protein